MMRVLLVSDPREDFPAAPVNGFVTSRSGRLHLKIVQLNGPHTDLAPLAAARLQTSFSRRGKDY
jgi:hypothetical protein